MTVHNGIDIMHLPANQRIVAINWFYSDDGETKSGTWFFGVEPHVKNVEATIRQAMQNRAEELGTYEAIEDAFDTAYPNWGDAIINLDLAALGIHDLTPILTETYEVDHDEALIDGNDFPSEDDDE